MLSSSDVVVILVAFYETLVSKDEKLKMWVEFGTGRAKKCFAVHEIAQSLGTGVCGALMFFHSFTGADLQHVHFLTDPKRIGLNIGWNTLEKTGNNVSL